MTFLPAVSEELFGKGADGYAALAAAALRWTPEMDEAVDAVHQLVGNPSP